MKVKALDQFDNFKPGDEADLPPEYAKGVVEKGLAEFVKEDKSAPAQDNKMAATPDNKAAASKVGKAK